MVRGSGDTDAVESILQADYNDSEAILEFPGVLLCSNLCVNNEATETVVQGAEYFLHKGGFCQICRSNLGFYASFNIPGGHYILTPHGEYKHEGSYHSIRSKDELFVIEEDPAYYEESTIAVCDYNFQVEAMERKMAAANHLMSIFDDIFGDE